jgi:hypothetical protein
MSFSDFSPIGVASVFEQISDFLEECEVADLGGK